MQSLKSVPSKTLENIKFYISDAFSCWLSDWSVSENSFTVDVSYKQLSNIDGYKSFACDNLSLLINDNQFSWQDVIFNDLLLELPEKIDLSKLVLSSKEDFVDSLSKGRKWLAVEKYTPPKHYNIYISIDIYLKNEKLSFLVPVYCAFKIFDGNKKSVNKFQLAKRDDLLSEKKCELNVKLNFGEFSVAELSSLVAGSILCPDLMLDNKFLLEANGLQVADVAIGKVADKKAFMISGGKSDRKS